MAGRVAEIPADVQFFANSVHVQKRGTLHPRQVQSLSEARALIEKCRGDFSALSLLQSGWRMAHGQVTPFDDAVQQAFERLAAIEPHYGARTPPGRVYFILCGDACKIGFTGNMDLRFAGLQAANPVPLKILAHIAGTLQEERRLHAQFAELRMNGEWFRYEGALKEYVEGLRNA